MAKVFTDKTEERLIDDVRHYGLKVPSKPHKLMVLRLALARSLQIATPPDESFDHFKDKGPGYDLKQVTGQGVLGDDGLKDFDEPIRVLLSLYYDVDLVTDEKLYRIYLQRHIRRGLREIRTSWSRGHNFISYLQHELFSSLSETFGEGETISSSVIEEALRDIGVNAELRKTIEGPRLNRCLFFLNDVQHFDRLRKGLDKLSLLLGLGEQGVLLQTTDEAMVVALDIPRPIESWKQVSTLSLRDWVGTSREQDCVLPVWLGQDVSGSDFGFDLSESPHILVAGTTGSGKSVCLHSMIVSLIGSFSTNEVQLALIDPKQVEFSRYEKLPHLFGGKVVYLASEAISLLDELVVEMEKRNEQLRNAGVASLQDGIEKNVLNLPYIVIIIEELADLIMQSQEVEFPLVRLAQKARATGIHLVLATQRPDANILTGLIRSNIPGRIALRVQKSTESRIILDDKGAEALLGKGDMLVKVPPHLHPVRVHGGKVTQDDFSIAQGKLAKGGT